MKILVTGGTGFIGSHTCVVLMQMGHEVVILDNLENSDRAVIGRIAYIVGREPVFIEGDIRDKVILETVLCTMNFDAVIHFAGLKAVGESVAQPLRYWECNVAGTITLLQTMSAAGLKNLVFSSSATVYGDPESVPISEGAKLSATNPYGQSKLTIERLLGDLAQADPEWRIACLRYFNPVGAHPSGQIGEDPRGVPNNLMPFVSQVACGVRERLSIFGNDYPTPDGTGVRDYIHVLDLAEGHLAALQRLAEEKNGTLLTLNLGTGRGISVLEMVEAFEHASGKSVPYQIVARRPGDVASCYADPSLAEALLGWKALRGVDEMCTDTWRWQSGNPHGYQG